jgi:hypothetical protein
MHIPFHRDCVDSLEDTSRPVSSVHVLSDEEDLRAALRRAAEFDQRAADMLLSRSARYRSLLTEPDRDEAGE